MGTRSRARTALPLAALVAGFVGCGTLFGLDGLTGGEPDGGASEDATMDDAGTDGAPTGSGDGSCACLPVVPAGWSVVVLGERAAVSCPAGYADASSVVVDPALGPATCECTCAVSQQPSCLQGMGFYVAGCADSGGYAFDPHDGGCTPNTYGPIAASHLVDPVPPSGGACTAKVSTKLPEGGAPGVVCGVGANTCTGGDGGAACAPAVLAPFTLCIARDGTAACPAGYSASHAAGPTIADTRGCGACACGGIDAGCAATFSWFADTACATLVASIPADGTCQANMQGDASAYRYAATAQASCDPPAAQPKPTGTASLTSPVTICCP